MSFPHPTAQALDCGVICEEDNCPESVRAIHEERAREVLIVLRDLDALTEARRRALDSISGKPSRRQMLGKRLQTCVDREIPRLEHDLRMLMDAYEDAFGNAARDAFEQAIMARHASILTPPSTGMIDRGPQSRRLSASLPVAQPLPHATPGGESRHGACGQLDKMLPPSR